MLSLSSLNPLDSTNAPISKQVGSFVRLARLFMRQNTMAEIKSMKTTTLETIAAMAGIDNLSWIFEAPFVSFWLDKLPETDPARSIDVVVLRVEVAIVE